MTLTTEQLQQIAELVATALTSAKSTDKPASGKGKSTAPKSKEDETLEANASKIKELREENKRIRAEQRKQEQNAWFNNLSKSEQEAFLANKQEKRDKHSAYLIRELAYQNVCKALQGKERVSKEEFKKLLDKEIKRLSAKK